MKKVYLGIALLFLSFSLSAQQNHKTKKEKSENITFGTWAPPKPMFSLDSAGILTIYDFESVKFIRLGEKLFKINFSLEEIKPTLNSSIQLSPGWFNATPLNTTPIMPISIDEK